MEPTGVTATAPTSKAGIWTRGVRRQPRSARATALMTPPRRRHGKGWGRGLGSTAGFTLLELMAVVFILGLVLTIASPRLEDISGVRVRSTSRKLASTIRYLYSLAIFDKSIYRLRFDFDNGTFATDKLVGQTFVPVEDPLLKHGRMPDGVWLRDMRVLGRDEVVAGEESLLFFPQGYVERAVLHLTNHSGDLVFTLVTKSFSGRVAIFDEDRDIELTGHGGGL